MCLKNCFFVLFQVWKQFFGQIDKLTAIQMILWRMDFCNNTTYPIIESINFEGVESQEYLYKVLVPILLAGCVLSLLLNSVLVAVGTMSRKSIRTRSPILVLSLNLAATDGIASLLMGLGLLINSYLPVVFGINLAGDHGNCSMLIFEILRLSSLIASAMHLLALALVHYKGIVNPLHYRWVCLWLVFICPSKGILSL